MSYISCTRMASRVLRCSIRVSSVRPSTSQPALMAATRSVVAGMNSEITGPAAASTNVPNACPLRQRWAIW